MDKKTLEIEKDYLESTEKQIDASKAVFSKKIKDNTKSIADLKQYFADNYYDIRTGRGKEFAGEDEFANINITIEGFEKQNDDLSIKIAQLTRQKKTPYFGRFDFKADDEEKTNTFYIGLGSIRDNENKNIVYDWRADVCTLYYDNKFGKTYYLTNDEETKINGQLSLKRQYKIENGVLKYYFDSNMVIDDDILMEQLSKNTTSKMHEIVSTIQQEQNVLIRDTNFENIIVQGVAGSGKTSIAMHRVSYLLYKYRKELKAEDILIMSPSDLFADYINDVLPSLGEEEAFTTTFFEIAKRNLKMPFESREQMLERVIGLQKQQDFEEIAIKSSFEFLQDLKDFLNNDVCNLFIPKTMEFGNITITKDEIKDIFFNRLKNLEIHKRIEVIADAIVDKFKLPEEFKEEMTKRAKKMLYNKFLTTDLLKIYNIFLQSVGLEQIEAVGAYDIAPMLVIKENLFGLSSNFEAKYVIVDEMQDYTPCHFYLFEKMWSCPKLYLGDIYQSIDRTLPEDYLQKLAKMTHSKLKFLTKSYRSTLQISKFAQRILGKHISENVNRNGEDVEFIKTKNCATEIEKIVKSRQSNENTKEQSIAIICKTKEMVKKLQKSSNLIKKFKLLANSTSNSSHIITTPAEAKGVEFDCVIVPFVDKTNFRNELDKNLLYVSTTRALHKLFFVTDGEPTEYLQKSKQ